LQEFRANRVDLAQSRVRSSGNESDQQTHFIAATARHAHPMAAATTFPAPVYRRFSEALSARWIMDTIA
jgi:hypothetical protein